MRLLLVSATALEILPIIKYLEDNAEKRGLSGFKYGNVEIDILITGVGQVACTFALAKMPYDTHIDLAIQLGLAGVFDHSPLQVGDVGIVSSDRFADIAIELPDGSTQSFFDLGLEEPNVAPYKNGKVYKRYETAHLELPTMQAISVNTVSGSSNTVARRTALGVDIESMEGAAFYYACSLLDIDCFQLRAISNVVEVRNRDNWQLDLAIENLKKEFVRILSQF